MICFAVISGIIFVASLVGYIITAINSYYDDGYGLSISYGNKDLLILTIVFLLMLSLGLILTFNVKKGKKIEAYISPLFMLVQAMLFSVYLLCTLLKPIIKGYLQIDELYISSIISDVLSFAALGILAFATIKALKSEEEKSRSYLLVIAEALLAISIGLHCRYYATLCIFAEDNVGICYAIIGILQFVEFMIVLVNVYMDGIEKKKQQNE